MVDNSHAVANSHPRLGSHLGADLDFHEMSSSAEGFLPFSAFIKSGNVFISAWMV